MLEKRMNLWDAHDNEKWIVITTNGFVKKDGSLVMGRGCAREAKNKYPNLPYVFGHMIQEYGNHLYAVHNYKIIAFPVKHNWYEQADIKLIERSTRELVYFVDTSEGVEGPIYIPRPGCGNGKLDWKDVKPVLERYLDDRFVVVTF